MAPLLADSVPIDSLDRPRRIRFDIAACRCLYEDTGREFYDLFPAQGKWGPGSIALFLWAGLRWEDRRLSKQAVDDLVERFLVGGGRMVDLARPVNDALEKSEVFRALAPDKVAGAADPPSGGGSANGAQSSIEVTASATTESPG